VLRPIKQFCDSYVDDLGTFLNHSMAHLDHVCEFCSVMRDACLALKLEKCDFERPYGAASSDRGDMVLSSPW